MAKRDLNKYEKDYEELPFEHNLVNYRRRIVIENINKYQHRSILEIGCGLEPLFKHFSDFHSMTLVEPSEIFYKNACSIKEITENKSILIYNDFLEKVADNLKSHFDFIIVSCLLHELTSPDDFLKALYKLCDRDTVIHINVPNAGSFHRILAVTSGLIKDEFSLSGTQIKMQQSNVFSLDSLKLKLLKNRFQILNEGSYFIKPFTHAQMQALLDNHIIDQQILDGLFKISDKLPGWGAEIFVNAGIVN